MSCFRAVVSHAVVSRALSEGACVVEIIRTSTETRDPERSFEVICRTNGRLDELFVD